MKSWHDLSSKRMATLVQLCGDFLMRVIARLHIYHSYDPYLPPDTSEHTPP